MLCISDVSNPNGAFKHILALSCSLYVFWYVINRGSECKDPQTPSFEECVNILLRRAFQYYNEVTVVQTAAAQYLRKKRWLRPRIGKAIGGYNLRTW